MDRLKKHDDELDFFALELQSRRVQLGPWRGLRFGLYGLLSNYDRSYLRSLVAIFVVVVIGAGAFWYFDARTFGEALGLSMANTLNVFGFRGLSVCQLILRSVGSKRSPPSKPSLARSSSSSSASASATNSG